MRIDHIGIAVNDVEVAAQKFQSICPDIPIKYEKSKDGTMFIAHLIYDNLNIELMQPMKDEAAVKKFIEKRGEGIHHIAIEVNNIKKSMEVAEKGGIRIIDKRIKEGSSGNLISFLHPKDFHGVLVEFCQPIK